MSEIPDPSEIIRGELRQLLGEKLAAPIEARASELAAEFDGRDARWLRAGAAVLDDPLVQLREDASRIRVWEREHKYGEHELNQAQFRSKAAWERTQSEDPKSRAEAKKATDEAEIEAGNALKRVAELKRQRQPGDDRYRERWAEGAGERTARVLALHTALEQEVGHGRPDLWDVSRAGRIDDPLSPYLDLLGPELVAYIANDSKLFEAEIAALSPQRRLQERTRPYEQMPDSLLKAGKTGWRLRRDQEQLGDHWQVLDAKVQQLEATGYRPEVARTLRLQLERNVAEQALVAQQRQTAWAENLEEATTLDWLRANRNEIVRSIAVERLVVDEVEEHLRRREREAAAEEPPKLVRDYVPEARDLDAGDGGYGF